MTFLESLEQLPLSQWVSESPSKFAYPTVLWLHVMGMAIVVGISALISLRILGVSTKIPLKPLESLYPLMWFGFGINALTGTSLLLASATERLVDGTFYIKMLFIFIGVVLLQRTRTHVFRASLIDPDSTAKILAAASLFCWLGAVTAGRMIAYL
jgi:hypothetical protein